MHVPAAYFARQSKPRIPKDLAVHGCINLHQPPHDNILIRECQTGLLTYTCNILGTTSF